MAHAEIQKVNHRHEQVINWLLANPHRPLRDCAEFFGYTKEWIYRLVNTDMFQAAYRRRAEELGVEVVHNLAGRLNTLAAVAVDETVERIIGGSASDRLLADAMRMTLGALGYAGAGGQGDVHVHVDQQVIVEARERALALKEGRTEVKADGNGGA